MNLWENDPRPFRPSAVRIRRADEPVEILGHFRLRNETFCVEQRLFPATDRDMLDDGAAIPIVAISCLLGQDDEIIGTVRIHEGAPGTWCGSRLCVSRLLRGGARIGTALIHAAVSMARAEGCTRFLAHVQRPNVAFFEQRGWCVLGEEARYGVPHVRMEADLSRYPALPPDRLHLVPLRQPEPV